MKAQVWTDIDGITTAKLLAYDTQCFPFANLAASVFKVNALERLHEDWRRHKIRRGQPAALGYNDNLLLRAMLQKLDDESAFYKVYHSFVRQVIGPAFGRKISYSSHPKMRVHLAGTPTVSKWHRDADITGRPEQINVWLPFTNTHDGNSLWLESYYGRADYRPVTVAYGQALIFDGGFLDHGTVSNTTDTTRVSLDFRFAIVGADLPETVRAIFASRPDNLLPADRDSPCTGQKY
ncbi:streptomycin biosynthesis enzyme StrG [Methylovulum psychrotolerans]|uniref:Streptomycin biosynthesis enzyme StrG n=1 Tax=Methylovulum psychrotolerans TaxID=1704499 RepID=A0A1Z4BYD1_9GAMM|nr:streptomycin biosynthesis enzyme StrG [Methylovulum psychrotolerans]